MKNLNIDKKIIGIVSGASSNDEGIKFISIDDNLRKLIINKGCYPLAILPLANTTYYLKSGKEISPLTPLEEVELKAMVDICDGIIFQGGNRWYNYHDFIYRYALSVDKPILGICMGMQLMSANDNNRNTATKIESNIEHSKLGEKYAHKVIIEDNTLLSKIISEKTIDVNSNHKYAITSVNEYIVSARSIDGIIEAIELPGKRFCLGVQWHPEKMAEYDKHANELIDYFISKL